MKKYARQQMLGSAMGLMLMAGLLTAARAQDPVITSMRDGKITFTNLAAGQEYKVEWATSLTDTNGFRSSFAGMEDIVPTNTTAMTVDIPQFYRIRGSAGLSNNIYRASDIQLVINAFTNTQYSLEWAEYAGGPWYTSWEPFFEATSTGTVMRIPTPNYYRVTF